MSVEIPSSLKFDATGLIPVVVQERATGDVLMVGYANEESLARTKETGAVTFWSRSRNKLWQKGETSGNVLRLVEARTDCDRDVLLMVVEPAGPTCHTGTRTCFGDDAMTAAGILGELERVIAERARTKPEGSYTAKLLAGGDAALKKVGEEATEVVLAAKGDKKGHLAEESADLLYHLLVVLAQKQVPVASVLDVLRQRREKR